MWNWSIEHEIILFFEYLYIKHDFWYAVGKKKYGQEHYKQV